MLDAPEKAGIRQMRILQDCLECVHRHHGHIRGVEKIDAKRGVIHGDLTLHGTTRPVDVAFTLNLIAPDPYAFKRKAGFSASATLPRSAFGIKRYADVIGENIQVLLEIEGLRDGSAAPKEP